MIRRIKAITASIISIGDAIMPIKGVNARNPVAYVIAATIAINIANIITTMITIIKKIISTIMVIK
jgi:hypothetical protein